MIEDHILFLYSESRKFNTPFTQAPFDKAGVSNLLGPIGYELLVSQLDDTFEFELAGLEEYENLLLANVPAILDTSPILSFDDFIDLLGEIQLTLINSVSDMLLEVLESAAPNLSDQERDAAHSIMEADVWQWVSIIYLQSHYPPFYKLGLFFDFIQTEQTTGIESGEQIIRQADLYVHKINFEKIAAYSLQILSFIQSSISSDSATPQEFFNHFIADFQRRASMLMNNLYQNLGMRLDVSGFSITTLDVFQIEEEIVFTSSDLEFLHIGFLEQISLGPATLGTSNGAVELKFHWKSDITDALNEIEQSVGEWQFQLPAEGDNGQATAGVELVKQDNQISLVANGFFNIKKAGETPQDPLQSLLDSDISIGFEVDATVQNDLNPPRFPAPVFTAALTEINFDGAGFIGALGDEAESYALSVNSAGSIITQGRVNPAQGFYFQTIASLDEFGLLLPKAIAKKGRLEDGRLVELVDEPVQVKFHTTDSESNLLQLIVDSNRQVELGVLQNDAGQISNPTITIDPFYIGDATNLNNGFLIIVDGATFELNDENTRLLEGIAVKKASVHFPEAFEALERVDITDASINNNGFSGQVSVVFDEGAVSNNTTPPDNDEIESVRPSPLFGVLPIQLFSLQLEFIDNLPTAFELKAAVELPYFNEWIDLRIGIDANFNIVFILSSNDPEGIVLTKDELLSLTFRSAGFEYFHDLQLLRLSMSGAMEPLLWGADGLEWPKLDVTNLVLEYDLTALPPAPFEPPYIKFDEAWLDLKDLATLDLFGFYFELERIGMGYIEDTDKLWLDLTGSVRLIEVIPIGVGVEGFRITWPRRIYEELNLAEGDLSVDDLVAIAGRIEVKFDGVYLFFGVPQAVEIEGYIRFIKEAQKVGFAGDMALRLPATGLALEAGLMIGINFEDPPYPFLYVYFGILLPSGIPLGQSGLALKGAKGLFGLNVVPDRTPEQNPYYDWYKRGPIEGAHPTNKWRDQIWSIALGAGITITTTDGKILGVQGLLALVIPGPIIFIEGKALVFDGIFPSDGPLKALAFFDGNELTIQCNIEAGMELVEGVIDVNAGIEAFFDFRNLSNWHFYLGKDEPAERRVRANILKLPAIGWLFEASSYLMIDMQDADTLRARLGAYIAFEPPEIDLVVAHAKVKAVIDGVGLLTINPFQFNGQLGLDAVVDVAAFGFNVVGVEASADLSVEGALPFVTDARVAVHVDLPIPNYEEVPVVGEWAGSIVDWFEENVTDLPDIPESIDFEVPFHWEFDAPPVIPSLVQGVSVQESVTSHSLAAATSTQALEDIWKVPVVSLDARPSVIFDQDMNQSSELSFAGFSSGQVRRFESGNLSFRPKLHDVMLWQLPHTEFDAQLSVDEQPWQLLAQGSSEDHALWGAFRPLPDQESTVGAPRRVLDLWSGNVFSFLNHVLPLSIPANDVTDNQGESSLTDWILGADGLLWCKLTDAQEQCIEQKTLLEASRDEKQQPVLVSAENQFQMSLHIRDVEFVSDDLFIRKSNQQGDDATLIANASPRQKVKLTIHMPEAVRYARITLHKASKTEINPTVHRRGDVDFVFTGARKKGPSPRVGSRCARTVAATVKQQDRTTEIVAEDWFQCIQIVANGPVEIVELCWVTLTELEEATIRQDECDFNAEFGDRAKEFPELLSPGSFYRMETITSIKLDETESDWATLTLCESIPQFFDSISPYMADNGSAPESVTHYFQTAGPPADLSPYVKWLSPMHQSAEFFYDDDFVIRFNRSYLHQLYPNPDTHIELADYPYAVQALLQDSDGHILDGFFHNWTRAGSATLFPDEKLFFEAVENSPSPLAETPGDDVLEIRRNMLIINGLELGASAWKVLNQGSDISVDSKWKRLRDGTIQNESLNTKFRSYYLLQDYQWNDNKFEFELELEKSDNGEFGIVFGFDSLHSHYLLRISHKSKTLVEIAKVGRGVEKILSKQTLSSTRNFRRGPIRIERLEPRLNSKITVALSTTRSDNRFEIGAIVNGVQVRAVDRVGRTFGPSFGLFARGVTATFGSITVAQPMQGLKANTRYQLILTGGVGGKLIYNANFADRLPDEEQLTTIGSWVLAGGLTSNSLGSTLNYKDSMEDVELITQIFLGDLDVLRIDLRKPDEQRASGNDTTYQITLSRIGENCDVSAEARNLKRNVSQPIGQKTLSLGPSNRASLRIRLIGSLLRIWLNDQLAVDSQLKDYLVSFSLPDNILSGVLSAGLGDRSDFRRTTPGIVPATGGRTRTVKIPIAHSGLLQWVSVHGTPVIHAIEIRNPYLLRTSFTTSVFPSVNAVFQSRQIVPDAVSVPGYDFAQFVSDIGGLTLSQRALADVQVHLRKTQALYSVKRIDREALEFVKQDYTRNVAEHDFEFNKLLASLALDYFKTPTQLNIQQIKLESGELLGYFLHFPVPIDPEWLCTPTSNLFETTGRTSFNLLANNGAEKLPTAWLSSEDGTRFIVYQRSGQNPVSISSANEEFSPVTLLDQDNMMSATYIRHHGDDLKQQDHLYDRPYTSTRSRRTPEVIPPFRLTDD